MRKLLPLGVFLSLGLFLTSCTHEYDCQCIIKYTGHPPGLPDSSIVEFKIRNTKKQSASECEANSATSTKDGVTMTETCRLY